MFTAIAATLIITLGALDDPPQHIFPVHTTRGVLVEAGGHPYQIDISAIIPSGSVIPIITCLATPTCQQSVKFPQCGNYRLDGLVSYSHGLPGGGTFTIALAAFVTIVGCDIFADGFETGTTDEWSNTAP